MADFITVKRYKARGKRLTTYPVESITQLESIKKQDLINFESEVESDAEESREIQKSLFDLLIDESKADSTTDRHGKKFLRGGSHCQCC